MNCIIFLGKCGLMPALKLINRRPLLVCRRPISSLESLTPSRLVVVGAPNKQDVLIYYIYIRDLTMVFIRPAHIPFPTTWHRFHTDRGMLRIQDLTPDMHEQALELLSKYFMRDEPPCKYIGIQNYPSAMAELQKLWRTPLKDNLSLVCVEDNDEQPPKIVGVNVLSVVCKEDQDEPFQTDDPIWAQLYGAVELVKKSVDIFEKYKVDKYLNADGLVVDPAWRGCGVGKELLSARIPLCKALDIRVTATVFTAGASQAVAKKVGFVDLSEITYEEIAKRGFIFPGIEKDTKSSKLMALTIE